MVLEALTTVKGLEKHPVIMLVMSIVLASAGIWLSYYTFPASSSILAIAFVSIGFMPIFHRLFVVIESEEAKHHGWFFSFLGRHFDVIKIYAWFFLGLIIAYCFWYVVLPDVTPAVCMQDSGALECLLPEKSMVFAEQEKTWKVISGWSSTTAKAILGPGVCSAGNFFGCAEFIFTNNALVLGLAILFSFVYGAGAIFLLAWNASVIGIFIGKEILEKSLMHGLLRAVGYLPHGLPEIIGYFIGAIAGAIISVAISKRQYGKKEFEIIAKDALFLIALSYGVLLLAALIESGIIVTG